MTPSRAFSLSVITLGLAVGSTLAWADDASNTPPQPPPNAPATGPANGAQGPRHRRPYSLAELTQKLGLSADQQSKVGAVISSAKSQAKAVRADTTLSKDDRRSKMVAIMKAAHDQIRADLTLDQQAEFDALQGPGRGQGNPPAN